MKKSIKIILIVLLILIIVGGVVYGSITIINKTNKERKEQEKIENEIIETFDTFKEAISEFNIEWSTYNTVIEPDINENTVYQYDAWILSLDSYTKAVDEVEEASKVYKENCINKYYSNTDVKNKCAAWLDAYEKAINSYVQDINTFNTMIDEINEENDSSLEKYETTYKLVDLNDDDIFSEIEVQDSEDE